MERAHKCSSSFFLGKKGRKTVQTVKNYGGSKYYGSGCRSIFSTGGSEGLFFDRRLKLIQYRTGVWECLRSLPPDASPSTG